MFLFDNRRKWNIFTIIRLFTIRGSLTKDNIKMVSRVFILIKGIKHRLFYLLYEQVCIRLNYSDSSVKSNWYIVKMKSWFLFFFILTKLPISQNELFIYWTRYFSLILTIFFQFAILFYLSLSVIKLVQLLCKFEITMIYISIF